MSKDIEKTLDQMESFLESFKQRDVYIQKNQFNDEFLGHLGIFAKPASEGNDDVKRRFLKLVEFAIDFLKQNGKINVMKEDSAFRLIDAAFPNLNFDYENMPRQGANDRGKGDGSNILEVT